LAQLEQPGRQKTRTTRSEPDAFAGLAG
jgi:hypothetical protein